MAETIAVSVDTEVINIASPEEIISVDLGDEHFTLVDTTETFTVSITEPQPSDSFTIDDVSETINAEIVEDVIDASSTIEVLDFTSTEQVIINNFYAAQGGDSELVYAERVDFVEDTHLFKGWALPGSLESAAAWKIQKLTFVGADGNVVITWAAGAASFDNIWSDRIGLSYS
jgi:hypothetical protein